MRKVAAAAAQNDPILRTVVCERAAGRPAAAMRASDTQMHGAPVPARSENCWLVQMMWV